MSHQQFYETVQKEEEAMNTLAASLVKAQKQFAPALKTSTNPHFRSKYADLSACVEAVIDALNANGIALIQRTLPCDDGVNVETVFVHESGEQLSGGVLHVPAVKNDPQGYGSALTYARRYSLMAATGIAPEDDDGQRAKQSGDAELSRLEQEGTEAAEKGTDALRAFYSANNKCTQWAAFWKKNADKLQKIAKEQVKEAA